MSPLREYQHHGNKVFLDDPVDALNGDLLTLTGSPLIVTNIAPHPDERPDARPKHNSLTTDRRTPRVALSVALSRQTSEQEVSASPIASATASASARSGEDLDVSVPLYAMKVWPYLLGC